MKDFKSGNVLGKAVGYTSKKGTFGLDIKKQKIPPKRNKSDFKSGAGLAGNV